MVTVLDYLLKHNIVSSKEEALKQVLIGNVISEHRKLKSIHEKIKPNEVLKLKNSNSLYVSRGGDKIASVFLNFDILIKDKIGLDCGASTGGFTDYLLQNGALKIITIDVGYGILDNKLINDCRVVNFDRTNIRNINKLEFQNSLLSHKNGPISLPLDFCVADLSFISLKLILPVVRELLRKNADILCLFKPQFELPKELIPEGGIVTDNAIIKKHLDLFISLMKEKKLQYVKSIPSLVQGTKGNQEYFIHFKVC